MSEPFDPDAFLAKKDAPFDPDAFLASPVDDLPPVVQPGPSTEERVLGSVASFASGSPLFGLVSRASDSLTGQNSQKSAARATEQFSPKVAGVPVLPVLGGIAATLPAGAANIAPRAGAALLGTRGAMAARVGLQGGIGGVQAADRGGSAGDVALGTGVGLAGGVLGEGVGAGLTRAGQAARPALEKVANSQAVKALLGGGTMVNRLKNQLGVTDEAGLQALGKDVRGLGVLGFGPIPRGPRGINEGVEGVLASSGDEIGRIREFADTLVASGKASPANAVEMAQAYERGVLGASRLADQSDVAQEVASQGAKFVRQATPPLGGVPTTEGGTFKALWDQSSRMQKGAFKPTDSLGDALAKRELSRAGVQSARGNLSQQMEGVVGLDEMSNLAEAMKRYSTAARVSDVTADTAARNVAKSTFGLGDNALVQTMGLTGPAAAAALPLVSAVRSRGNAAVAMYAPYLGRAAGPALGLTGAAARMAAPAATRKQEMKPEEEDGIDAFLSNSP
jgi:hypothetical protein